ncbi:MAG: class I SAM-dependent methyltransferase [Spirochaetaceae bacterium]|nr:MAG: class I SAM-dependent methyltransferase [Spirochaetaceae bacterium]
MSSFYSILAQYYDTLFPAENETVDFLEETFGGVSGVIVDAACGTGNYTAALASRGMSVVGFDADQAMIARARCCGRDGRFLVGSLEDIPAITAAVSIPWGGMFCIGNSLPHLSDRGAVDIFFREAARVLASPGSSGTGRLVVQVINFARFAPPEGGEERARPLPPVERTGITMRREYRPSSTPGTTVFHVELEREGEESVSATTPLLTLRRDELVAAARAAGFTGIRTYGGYEGSPFDEDDSFLLCIVAEL